GEQQPEPGKAQPERRLVVGSTGIGLGGWLTLRLVPVALRRVPLGGLVPIARRVRRLGLVPTARRVPLLGLVPLALRVRLHGRLRIALRVPLLGLVPIALRVRLLGRTRVGLGRVLAPHRRRSVLGVATGRRAGVHRTLAWRIPASGRAAVLEGGLRHAGHRTGFGGSTETR